MSGHRRRVLPSGVALPAGVELRGERLYVTYNEHGRRHRQTTDLRIVGEHDRDLALVEAAARIRDQLRALAQPSSTPDRRGLTVDDVVARLIVRKRERECTTADETESRMRRYVSPAMGSVLADDVARDHWRRHFIALRDGHADPVVRHDGARGPMDQAIGAATLRHIYHELRQAFAEALEADPPILTRTRNPIHLEPRMLPKPTTLDPAELRQALFRRPELATLASSSEIPIDRRIHYAIAIFTGARQGEVSMLRLRDLDLDARPLASLLVESPKTGAVRQVPVHPALRRLLASWVKEGWAKTYGRSPVPDDYLVPPTLDRRHTGGRTFRRPRRTKEYIHHRWKLDLAATGLRHRKFHALRHSFISLAVADGAPRTLVEQVTHPPPNATPDAFSGYLHPEWEAMCRAVALLQIPMPDPDDGDTVAVPVPTGDAVALDLRATERAIAHQHDDEPERRGPHLSVVPTACAKDAPTKKKGSGCAAFGVTPPGIEPGFLG